MTTTQRVNLVRNAEEHIRALTAVIDLCPHIPEPTMDRGMAWWRRIDRQ